MAAEEEDRNSLHLTQHMMNSRSMHVGPYPSPIPPSTPPSAYGPLRSPSPAPSAQFGNPYRMMPHSVFGTQAPSASLAPGGYYPPSLEQRYAHQSTTNYQRYAQLQQQLQKSGYSWTDPQMDQFHRPQNQSGLDGSLLGMTQDRPTASLQHAARVDNEAPRRINLSNEANTSLQVDERQNWDKVGLPVPGNDFKKSETTNMHTAEPPSMVKVETTNITKDETPNKMKPSETSLINQCEALISPESSNKISTDPLLLNDNAIVEPSLQAKQLSQSKELIVPSHLPKNVASTVIAMNKAKDAETADSKMKDVDERGDELSDGIAPKEATFEAVENIEVEVDIGRDLLDVKMETSPTQKKESSPRKELSPRKKPTPVEGVFPCDLEGCEYVGKTDFGLINHKKKHVREDGYDCLDCGESFNKTQMLVAHSVQHHGGIKCPHCEKRFSVRNGYNQHIKVVHLKERFPCNVCGKDFGCKTGLTTHMNMHMGLKPYQCEMCDKTFPGMDNLYRHKRLHCKGQIEATCPVCGKTLPRKEYLEKHMKMHSVGKTKTFSNEEKVEAVALAKMLGVRLAAEQLNMRDETLNNWVKLVTNPLYCSICGHVTYAEKKLKAHEKKHTQDGNMARMPKHSKSSSYQQREYPCDQCPARGKDQADLTRHRRRVHGIDLRTIDDINQHARYKEKKAFPCLNCPKSYSSQYRLNDHKKVCSGASSVLSNNTDPAFINEVVAYAMETTVLTAARAYKVSNTTIHNWIRNLENSEPEVCTYCGQECKHKNALGKHMRRYHTDPETGVIIPQHLRERVVEYAADHTIEQTAEKFKMAVHTATRWVKLANSPLVCEYCSKAFDSQYGLDKHRQNQHLSKDDEDDVNERILKPDKPGNRDLLGLKEMFESKYGKLTKEEIPRGVPADSQKGPKKRISRGRAAKGKVKMEEVEEDEEGFTLVKEEAFSEEEVEDQEMENDEMGEEEMEEEEDVESNDNQTKDECGDGSDCEFDAIMDDNEDDDNDIEESSPLKKEMKDSQLSPEHDFNPEAMTKLEMSLKEEPTSDVEQENHEAEDDLADESEEEKDKPYGCDLCDFKAARKDNVGNHMKRVHGVITHGCRMCDVRVRDKDELKTHMADKHGVVENSPTKAKRDPATISDDEKFHCPDCDKKYTNHSGLWLHKKVTHEGRMWYCDQCSASFRRPGALSNHMESVHEMRRYQCDKCAKDGFTRRGLAEHKRTIHQGLIFSCELCGLQFTQPGNLRTHIKNIHDGERHICNLCGATYNQSNSLAAHMKSKHEGVTFPCPACEGNFNSKGALKLHFAAKHEGKRYSCDQCDYKASQKSNLSAHKQRKHIGPIPVQLQSNE